MKTQDSVWMKALDVVLVGGLFLVASGIILGGTVLAGVLFGWLAAILVFGFCAGVAIGCVDDVAGSVILDTVAKVAWLSLWFGSGGNDGSR